MGTIWKPHDNKTSKSDFFVFQAAFISPQSDAGKANVSTVDCTVWQVNKEKRKTLIHMLSGSAVGAVICASCLWLAGWGTEAAPVMLLAYFVSCAIPFLLVRVGWLWGCWGLLELAHTSMCQFYYSYCSFAYWEKSCFVVTFFLTLPIAKFLSGIFCHIHDRPETYLQPQQSHMFLYCFILHFNLLELLLSLCWSPYLTMSHFLNID